MGSYLSAPAGHRLAEHGGGWCGTSTWIGRYLDDDLAVIVLSNDESFDARALGMQLAATALGDPRLETE